VTGGNIVGKRLKNNILENKDMIFIDENINEVNSCKENFKYINEITKILLHNVIIAIKLGLGNIDILFELNTENGEVEYTSYVKTDDNVYFLYRYSNSSVEKVSIKTFKTFFKEINFHIEKSFKEKANKINKKFIYLLEVNFNKIIKNSSDIERELLCIKDNNVFICPEEEFINYKIKNISFKLRKTGYLRKYIRSFLTKEKETEFQSTLIENNFIYPQDLDKNMIYLRNVKVNENRKIEKLKKVQIEMLKDLQGMYIKCSNKDDDFLFDYRIKDNSRIEVLVYWLYAEDYRCDFYCFPEDFYMYYRALYRFTITDIYSDRSKYIFHMEDIDQLGYDNEVKYICEVLKMFIESMYVLEKNLHKLKSGKEIGDQIESRFKNDRIYIV